MMIMIRVMMVIIIPNNAAPNCLLFLPIFKKESKRPLLLLPSFTLLLLLGS